MTAKKAPEPARRVVARYELAVELLERVDGPARHASEPPEPSIDEMLRLVSDALYEYLPYYGVADIRVAVMRADR